MSGTVPSTTDIGSIEGLRERGFEGFQRTVDLKRDGSIGVPIARGVYAVARESLAKPKFMPSNQAGHWRNMNPSMLVPSLEEEWVPTAQVLYFGVAPGPGVRSLLQQRVKRMMRFGDGKRIAHWSGRYLWQLADHAALLVSWLPTPDEEPRAVEARLRREFIKHHGRLPFANLSDEKAESEE